MRIRELPGDYCVKTPKYPAINALGADRAVSLTVSPVSYARKPLKTLHPLLGATVSLTVSVLCQAHPGSKRTRGGERGGKRGKEGEKGRQGRNSLENP